MIFLVSLRLNFFHIDHIMVKLNFLEIGTCDFDTEIEKANDSTCGISVEPLKFYLDKLPNKQNCKKINCAISDTPGKTKIYYADTDVVIKYSLPWWLKGCSSMDPNWKPFTEFVDIVVPRDELIREIEVEVKTFEQIVTDNEIESIDFFKVDTEGHDHVIVRSYLEYCKKNPNLFAPRIQWEAVRFDHRLIEDEKNLMNEFETYGYKGQKTWMDVFMQREAYH